MSLSPLPIVDGGTLYKWTLVGRGKEEAEADEIVRRVDWGMGIGTVALGIVLLSLQIWIAGLILFGVGIVAIGIVKGKIR